MIAEENISAIIDYKLRQALEQQKNWNAILKIALKLMEKKD